MFSPPSASFFRGSRIKPEDIPPPINAKLPPSNPLAAAPPPPQLPLTRFLQRVCRPTDLTADHLSALGLRIVTDASVEQIIPDPAYLPDFAAWEELSPEAAAEANDSTRQLLCIVNRSPGCQTYLDRRRELTYSNAVAFRTVRRLSFPKGQQAPKLGGSYDFWRCLEMLTMYWDDPTEKPSGDGDGEASGEASVDGGEAEAESADGEDTLHYRTRNAETIPHETLRGAMASFIKLATYEFGCTVQASRMEPRLHLKSPPVADGGVGEGQKCSTISSGCSFILRSPTNRFNARQGIVDGPLAAVSVRLSISFETDFEAILDFGREVVAALITAQHRSREGRPEKRFGEGEWWTSKPRWGGGSGGPIGRELDKYDVGDKDAGGQAVDADGNPVQGDKGPKDGGPAPADARPLRPGGAKSRKPTIFDMYRQVRPPASTWDPKMRYEAIGKVKGADYDDVFVVSGLFHHISILRFRVPDRLLQILDGAAEETPVSWGGMTVWRSRWFDLFVQEERMAALRILWGMMAYQMRKQPGES